MKNYKITVAPTLGCWHLKLYALKLTPVYEHGNPEPVRQQEDWVRMKTPFDDDLAATYWGARWMAWRLKYKLDHGKLRDREETIYERKGSLNGKS